MLDDSLEQVRDLSIDLRPLLLDDFGLVTALRWYVDRQAPRMGVRAEFTSNSLDPDLRFSPELETACFRIAHRLSSLHADLRKQESQRVAYVYVALFPWGQRADQWRGDRENPCAPNAHVFGATAIDHGVMDLF